MKLYFVGITREKLKETRDILNFEHLGMMSVPLPEIQAKDVEVIASEKSRIAAERTKLSMVVEETGLYINALNGFPGALAKSVLKDLGNKGILKLVEGEDRSAVAKVAIGVCVPGNFPKVFVGEIKGKIAKEERGNPDLGWKRIFIPEDSFKTLAEMTPEEINQISMRKKALEKIDAWLHSYETF